MRTSISVEEGRLVAVRDFTGWQMIGKPVEMGALMNMIFQCDNVAAFLLWAQISLNLWVHFADNLGVEPSRSTRWRLYILRARHTIKFLGKD